MKINFIFLLFFLVPGGVFSQLGTYSSSDMGVHKEGYIVKSNYDTINGYIFIDEPHFMEYSISFSQNQNGSNSSIERPDNLISFSYSGLMGKEVIWVSTQYSVLNHPPEESYAGEMEQAFLNVAVYGPVTVYNYYNYNESAEKPKSITQYMQLPDAEITIVNKMMLGFSKKMPKYIEDYTDLAKKVSKKEKGYKFMQLSKIIEEYNQWYQSENGNSIFYTAIIPKKAADIGDEIIFSGSPITFDEHPGIEFWLSDQFKRYQKWDTQKTGDAMLSVALKISNQSKKNIAKISPSIIAYDIEGNIMKQLSGGTSTYGFEPNPGNVFNDNYIGVYDAFFSTSMADVGKLDKVEFTLNELGYASERAISDPVFNNDWIEFEEYKGFKFRTSDPFIFVDNLSGDNRFGIALEFKNESGKEPRRFNIQIKVYDNQGIYFDDERQNHNQLFEPGIGMSNLGFPADYKGVNKKFYTSEEDFIDSFEKIEFHLNSVEF